MPASATLLKSFRQFHRWTGLFISPSILFFALTGALQTFSLHETTKGSSYKPASWIVTLAQVHKHQTDVVPVKKPAPDKPAGDKAKMDSTTTATVKSAIPPPAPVPPPAPQKSHLPMKIFFLVVALGLFSSTLTGIFMAYRYGGSKIAVTLLLLAGIVVPLLLLPF